MPKPVVAAVILAAGGSTRFGEPKQLLSWHGRPLITHCADTAWIAGLSPVVVVTGAEANRIIPVLEDRDVRVMRNYRWQEGMSSSLSAGLAALPADVDAAIFIPVDQPLITAPFLQSLVAFWQTHGAGIVVPTLDDGQRGTPVLFARRYFPELATLTGDTGGRALFAKHADDLVAMPVSDPDILADVDTPEAYARLQEKSHASATGSGFSTVRGIVCDMDGVLWRGETPLPGLPAFFDVLHARDVGYVLVTNNSSNTPQQYVDKLAGLGITTTTDHVLNSSIAAADHLAAQATAGSTVFPIGGPGVYDALRSRGFRISEGDDVVPAGVGYVVVGWDRSLTWRKLATATLLIRGGAGFVATNPDLTFPMETGLVPGNGAQVAALQVATGVTPVVAGKPEPILYEQAMARMGTTSAETLVIGDRLDTDILGGLRLGMPAALVLSGISQREELARSPIQPTMVFENLAALVRAWQTE